MNSVAKGTEKRVETRRTADRRQTDLPFAGKERRVAERRGASDRRA